MLEVLADLHFHSKFSVQAPITASDRRFGDEQRVYLPCFLFCACANDFGCAENEKLVKRSILRRIFVHFLIRRYQFIKILASSIRYVCISISSNIRILEYARYLLETTSLGGVFGPKRLLLLA